MIVGESISRKIDPEGRRLKFKVPETEESSAESWRSLIDVDDDLRPLKDLQGGIVEESCGAARARGTFDGACGGVSRG